MKRGKRYQELAKLVDRSVSYDPSEAVRLVVETVKQNLMRWLNFTYVSV